MRVLRRILVICVMFNASAFAQKAILEDCSQQDTGERIKCKFSNVMAQQSSATTMIGDMPQIPENQKKALKKSSDQSERVKERMGANGFKQFTRKSKTQCQIAELLDDGIGDDDGICKGNEDCLEVLGDGIGNDDRICETKGKPANREVCVQICDQEAIDANPDNFDDPMSDSFGKDIEEQLDQAAEQYSELNDALELHSVQSAEFKALSVTDSTCAVIFDQRASYLTGLIASQVAVTLRGIAGQTSTVCDLDISGFNVAFVCLVTETVAAIAEVIDDSLDYVSAGIDSDTIDANYECVGELNLKIIALTESAGETEDALNTIMNQLTLLQQQNAAMAEQLIIMNDRVQHLDEQIQTPQGKRDNWNE